MQLTVDTGSASSFLNLDTVEKIMADKVGNAEFLGPDEVDEEIIFTDYNKKRIKTLGVVYMDVTSAGWEVERALFHVVDRKRCLLGMDLQEVLGIVTTQKQKQKQVQKSCSCCRFCLSILLPLYFYSFLFIP